MTIIIECPNCMSDVEDDGKDTLTCQQCGEIINAYDPFLVEVTD